MQGSLIIVMPNVQLSKELLIMNKLKNQKHQLIAINSILRGNGNLEVLS